MSIGLWSNRQSLFFLWKKLAPTQNGLCNLTAHTTSTKDREVRCRFPAQCAEHSALQCAAVRRLRYQKASGLTRIKNRIGSRVESPGARGRISRYSSLAPLCHFIYCFILMISPLVPNCSRAPWETERRCKTTPSELRSTMPPMPPARVSPASAAT